MLIEPSAIRNAEVAAKNHETLGTVVNVLFSTDPEGLFGDAYLVVFPNAENPLFADLRKAGYESAKTGLGQLAPGATDIINKEVDQGASIVEKYDERKEKKLLATFYLVPIGQVAEVEEGKKVVLNADSQAVKDFVYSETSSLSGKTMVFYRAMAPEEGRLWTNSLNFKPMQNFIVADAAGTKGMVESMVLDSSQSVVTSFMVRTVGPAAGKYSVSLSDFDFKTMCCKKAFAK